MNKESKMFELVAEWESSGLTRQEFCEERGVKLSNFSYWRTRYRQSKSASESGSFEKIKPALPLSIELIYPNGVRVVIPAKTDQATISSLIHLV